MRSVDQLWQRAERYLAVDQVIPARAVLESILARDPIQPRAHLVLGGIAWKQDRVRDAVRHALAAGVCEIRAPDFVCDVIAALVQVGESAAATRMFEHPLLKQGALSVPLLMRLSGQAQANGEHARSLALLRRAHAAGAQGPDFLQYLGVQLAFNGCMDEAEQELETCLRLDPAAGRAALILSRLRKQTPEHNHLADLRIGLGRAARGSSDYAALEFARYKELEDLQRYDEAWDALAQANKIMFGMLQHDPNAEAASVRRLIELTSGWTASDTTATHEGPTPIFIVGMPRSGTTLLSRVLGNHSQVADAGELGDFCRQLCRACDHNTPLLPDALALEKLERVDFGELGRGYLRQTQWRADGHPFYIDKLPANWVASGLIARALPSARILHMVRDPMDVCFSNWRAMFGNSYPYSYDMTTLAQHHAAYRGIMSHWRRIFPNRILDIAYRELVGDPATIARRIFEFCGLNFEPGCADVTRNARQIATLSLAQAREPIDARGLDQWQRYAAQLEPLRALISSA